MVASINPIQLKPSVFDYSTADIVELEKTRKTIKATEGKDGENYKTFKTQLNAIREVNFPFRTYVWWKRTKIGLPLAGSQAHYPYTKESRIRFKAELLSQTMSSPEMENKLRLLSRLTFIHGSNSATLAMMACSEGEPQLQCSGELMAKGIVPMSGELTDGVDIARNGVNLRNISVETVRAVERVLGYTHKFSFNPATFAVFQNPLLGLAGQLACDPKDKFVAQLQSWRREDREGFDAQLAPDCLKTVQLIEVLEKAIKDDNESLLAYPWIAETKQREIALLQHLIGMLRGEQEWIDPSQDCNYEELKSKIINPYQMPALSAESGWSELSIKAKQLKQWDFSTFQRSVLGCSEQWMQAIERERRIQEKPLKMLLAIIDHKFTEEEAFLKAYLTQNHSSSVIMPDSLFSIFSSLEDIPCRFANPNFDVISVRREMRCYRGGTYIWDELLNRTLVAKLQLAEGPYQRWASVFKRYNNQEHLDRLKPIVERQFPTIERGYNQVREALTSVASPRIQIPADEEFRSLITKPFPVIFASTVVKPEPYDLKQDPKEYLLPQSAPLGPEGCNILFTDTEESKEKIYRFMPKLQGRVDVRMISDLDVQGIPLCTALSQVIN